MCPPIRQSSVLRNKPVKPDADGFEAQTIKLSTPSFEAQTSKPGKSFDLRLDWCIALHQIDSYLELDGRSRTLVLIFWSLGPRLLVSPSSLSVHHA